MPRYFFNVRASDAFVRDEEGIDLKSLEDVRREAELSARGLLSEALKSGRVLDGQRFEIVDTAGQLVLTYPFQDAIRKP